MDYKEKYEQGLECLEEILNSGQEKIKMTLLKERLLPFFPELESENERMKKKCINFLNLHKRYRASSAEIDECIAWLEKQKVTDKEIVFRPLAGTDIIVAAKQALEKIEIGKEVVLAFNGAYIPVNGKTVAEICNEYFAWHEKQGEEKSKDETKNAEETSDEKVRKGIIELVKQSSEILDKQNQNNMIAWLEKQSGCFAMWKKNTIDNKPTLNHSVLMKSIHGMAEGEWNGKEWIQYRWSCKVKDSDVLYWMNLHELEKQGQETSWKPSKGQINALEHFVRSIGESGYASPYDDNINRIKSLLNDLCKLEKQDEQKPKETIKSAQETIDDWHKRQGTSVKTTAYGFFGKYGAVEYVYILDYSTGRVIVTKHDVEESFETLFDRLGLKENQCHYMTSSDVLSIEYINF